MNFDGFLRFCSDFEIFPDILSKPKLMRFFKTLSGFYESTSKQNQMLNEEENQVKSSSPLPENVIDEHLFIEALALTAFEIAYQNPQPSNCEKIILLMERLNHS